MDQIKKDELYKYITEIRNIMFSAQSSFKIVNYLYRERSGMEIEVVKRSQFLLYTASIHWQIYVTEMSKLFANRKGDKFNLHKLINKFKPTGEYYCTEILQNSVLIWEQNLKLDKEANLIKNLLEQRDSLYSHTDIVRDHIKNKFSFADAKEFLHIIMRTLSEIYYLVFNESMHMEPINEPMMDLKRIMRILVNEKQQWVTLDEQLNKEYNEKTKDYNTDKENMAWWYDDK